MTVHTSGVASITQAGAKEYPFISEPFRTSELSFRIGGPLQRFEIYPGNHYAKGSVIAQVDPRDFLVRKEKAEAVCLQAKAEYERIRILFEKNNISASSYEKAKADYASAKAAFDTASNELADTRLLAPFDGYAGEVYMENFQDVKPSQPILSFIDTDRLKLNAYVTQEVALRINRGDRVQVRFDGLANKPMEAEVLEISKGTSRNNLSYTLTAVLPNAGRELLAGMSGKLLLDVAGGESTTRLTIPQPALCHRPTEGNYVWVVESSSGKVSKRKVILDELLPNGSVAIAQGLTATDCVAVSGLRFLADGMSVQATKTR